MHMVHTINMIILLKEVYMQLCRVWFEFSVTQGPAEAIRRELYPSSGQPNIIKWLLVVHKTYSDPIT